MVIPELGFVLLFVNDPCESASFYERLFAIKPIEKSSTFVLFRLVNGVMLGLWSHKTAQPKVMAAAGACEIAFAANDVDSLYEQCLEHNMHIVQVPTEMDFGRTFVLEDDDGHRIRMYKLKV